MLAKHLLLQSSHVLPMLEPTRVSENVQKCVRVDCLAQALPNVGELDVFLPESSHQVNGN